MRSALYVAGNRRDHLMKAWSSDADVIVLELEDGVPRTAKEAAREAVVVALTATPPKPTQVRVNGFGTGLLLDDLQAVASTTVRAIRLPKVERPEDVITVARWLEEMGSAADIVPILETARGIEAAAEVARADPRVVGLLMGEEDLLADLGCEPGGLWLARSRVVLAARAAGLPAPLQSVWTRIGDLSGLRTDCLAGRELGFHGRSVIHPSQIAVVHEVYTPSAQDVSEARSLLELAGKGGTVLPDGRFVDEATIAQARRLLTTLPDEQ